jgi:hypothetical protein
LEKSYLGLLADNQTWFNDDKALDFIGVDSVTSTIRLFALMGFFG